MKRRRHLIADRAVRAHLVVVSTPSLAFPACLVEAQEPVGVQALRTELAVEALDEGIIRRLARPAEVKCDAAHESPQVEFLADELRPIVEPDRLWATHLRDNSLERFHDIAAA